MLGFNFRHTARAVSLVTATVLLTSCKFGFLGMNDAAVDAQRQAVVAPGPVVALGIQGPANLISGKCSTLFVVTGTDSNGSQSESFPQGTVVQIGGMEAGTIFLDSDCEISAMSQLVPSIPDSNRAEFYVKGRTSGSRVMTAALPGIPSTFAPVRVQSGPAANLVISFPSTINSNTCVQGSLSLFDENNNATVSNFDITSRLSLSVANGTALYNDGTCDNVITSGSIETGLHSKPIWIFTPATTAFTVAINSLTGIAGSQKNLTVNAANMPKLVLRGPVNPITAGVCTPFTVDTQYANNTPYKVRINTAVALTPNLSSTRFFSDTNCSAGIANQTVVVDAFSATKTFYLTATQAEQTLNLEASANGYTSGTSANPVIANIPTRLVFSGVPVSIPAARCSSELQVGLRDAYGNIAKAGANLPVALSFLGDALSFHGAADCGGAGINTVTINNAASLTSFYFKARNPGSAQIIAKAGTLTDAMSASILIKNALDVPFSIKLSLAMPSQPLVAGTCVAVRISSFDANNFPLDVFPQDIPFALSSSGSLNGIFYSNSGCSTPTNSVTLFKETNQNIFYFKNTKVEPQALLLSANSTNPNLTATLSVATTSDTPAQLEIVGNVTSVPAASCTSLQVFSKDQYGNLAATVDDMKVSLQGGQHVSFFADALCTQMVPEIKILSGSHRAVFGFKVDSSGNNAAVQTVTLVAVGPVGVAAGTKLISISPPTPLHIAFSNPLPFKAGKCQEISVSSLDTSNQLNIRENILVPLSVSGVSGNVLFSNSTCGTALNPLSVTLSLSNNPAKFYFRTTTSGEISISGNSGSIGSGTVNLTVLPEIPSQLEFLASLGSSTVDAGVCSGPYRVVSQDSFGNLSPVTNPTALTIAFSPSNSGGAFLNSTCTTPGINIPGNESTGDFYLKLAGSGDITATLSGSGFRSSTRNFTIRDAATITFKVNGIPVTALNFGNVVVGSSSAPVELTLVNASPTLSLSINLGTLAAPFSRSSGTCGANGFTLASSESCNLTLAFSPLQKGLASGNFPVTYSVGAATPTTKNLALSGNGTQPTTAVLVFNPSPASFGNVKVGETKKMDITLKNSGLGAATGLGFSSTAELYFEGQSACGGSIAPDSECTFKLVLKPLASGSFSKSIGVGYSDGAQAKVATMTADAAVTKAAELVLTLSHLNFGDIATGQEKIMNATLENRGTVEASAISLVLNSSNFFLNNGNCGATLPPGTACTFSVKFKPTSRASFWETALIQYSSTGFPGLTHPDVRLALSGTGFSFADLVLTPTSLDFPDTQLGKFRTLPVRLENRGDRPAEALTLIMTPPDLFVVDKNTNCPVNLNPGQSCTINISFSPRVVGWVSDEFQIGYSNPIEAKRTPVFKISGKGVTAAELTLTPSPLDVGTVVIDNLSQPKLLTLKNIGMQVASQVTLHALPANSDFRILSQTCPSTSTFTLNANDSCTYVIAMKPATVGTKSQTFSLNYVGAASDNSSTWVSSRLTGTAVNPSSLIFNTSTVDFGTVLKNASPNPRKVLKIGNSGSVPVTDITLAGLVVPFTAKPGTCGAAPFTLAAGAECNLEFEFATTGALGEYQSPLNISYDNGGTSRVNAPPMTVRGKLGRTAAVVVDVNPLNFDRVAVNNTKTVYLTVTNSGDFDAAISPPTNGNANFGLTYTDCASQIIPAGGRCTLKATFTPTTNGDFTRTLVIPFSDLPNGVTFVIYLNALGTGYTPGLLTSAAPAIDFGNTYINSIRSMALLLKNEGTSDISRIAASFAVAAPEITISNNACSGLSVLAPGASCWVTFSFSPRSSGLKSTHVNFTYVNESGPQSLGPILVRGTGLLGANLISSLNPVDFGGKVKGTTNTLNFTLTNNGQDTASGINLNAPANTVFSVVSNCNGNAVLAPNQTCSSTLTFKPTADLNVNYSFSFAYRSAAAPTIPLTYGMVASGKGLNPGSPALSVSLVDFGVPLQNSNATKRITLSNTGAAPITNVRVSGLTAPFSADIGSCGAQPFNLAAGGSCELAFSMNTATLGAVSKTFSLSYQ